MKAIVVDPDRDTIQFTDITDPAYSDTSILIETVYAGCNPVDWQLKVGQFRAAYTTIPFVLGWAVSGYQVTGAGRRRVVAYTRGPNSNITEIGTFSEYVAAPQDHVITCPDHLSLDVAAAYALPAATAAQIIQALDDSLGITLSSSKVLLNSQRGRVGQVLDSLLTVRGVKCQGPCKPTLAPFDVVVDLRGDLTVSGVTAILKNGGTLVQVASPDTSWSYHKRDPAINVLPIFAIPGNASLELGLNTVRSDWGNLRGLKASAPPDAASSLSDAKGHEFGNSSVVQFRREF